jgi:tetratricopeptide (TPR) repeat protein
MGSSNQLRNKGNIMQLRENFLKHSFESIQKTNFNKVNQPNYLEVASCFATVSLRDFLGTHSSLIDVGLHLDEAIQWLKRAHDINPDDGVSWGYSLQGRWRSSYRETSGYIVETFFDLAHFRNDEDSKERALEISHWLVDIQNPEGGIANKRYGSEGIVFDTGQVLQGLVRAYKETESPTFLSAAERSADWLVKISDKNGRWTRNTHNGIPHVYNSRVAWILLQLNSLRPTADRQQVAEANLDWAISQQQSSGLFEQCAFVPNVAPFTHTIAYAIRGLLEAGMLTDNKQYLESAIQGADAVLNHVQPNGFLAGQITSDGKSIGHYCCLTGNCQMAIIWLKIYQLSGEHKYYEAAVKSLQYVMAHQDCKTQDLNIRGGIKGSHPIWGNYTRLSYPNWATKFFIDALISLIKVSI